jgi:hypothetical protein
LFSSAKNNFTMSMDWLSSYSTVSDTTRKISALFNLYTYVDMHCHIVSCVQSGWWNNLLWLKYIQDHWHWSHRHRYSHFTVRIQSEIGHCDGRVIHLDDLDILHICNMGEFPTPMYKHNKTKSNQSFDHCVVCSSLIYGFWFPLWYIQILLTIIRLRYIFIWPINDDPSFP